MARIKKHYQSRNFQACKMSRINRKKGRKSVSRMQYQCYYKMSINHWCKAWSTFFQEYFYWDIMKAHPHKAHPFKVYNVVIFSIYPKVVQQSPVSNSKTFLSLPKETLYPSAFTLHPLPIHFLSLWIGLFWILHINGIIHVDFYVWLLSLSKMFSRLIYLIAYIRVSFLLMVELYSIAWIYPFVYPFLSWWAFGQCPAKALLMTWTDTYSTKSIYRLKKYA